MFRPCKILRYNSHIFSLSFYLQDLLQAVLPFDLLLDRSKRTAFLNNLKKCSTVPNTKPKVISDAGIALASLALCEEALERELLISTSYVLDHLALSQFSYGYFMISKPQFGLLNSVSSDVENIILAAC